MKAAELLDVHLADMAHREHSHVPGGQNNFQNHYTQVQTLTETAFDELVDERPHTTVETRARSAIVFRPVDLGKYAVQNSQLNVYALPSLERTLAIPGFSTRAKGEPSKRAFRTIRLYIPDMVPEGLVLTVKEKDCSWTFLNPLNKHNSEYFAPKATLDESRHRAIPSSVGTLEEFDELLSEVVAAAKLETASS